ncbi:glycosyltransferase family 4 protein [Micromonospora sp. NPDC050686]|uniref:glycosyltransferase family 4 protein n=1 Tax=Micromonospora sp. NPDC050686 TaxID=3154631 RepID=UPI0033FB8A80
MASLPAASSADAPDTLNDVPTTYRVLATCGVFEPGFRGGGPVKSVANVLDTLPGHIELLLITSDRDLGSSDPYPGLTSTCVRRGERAAVFYLAARSPRSWVRLLRRVRAQRIDLLYLNSLWSPYSLVPISALAAGLLSVSAVLIAPRGELSPGALGVKRRKKQIFLRVWSRVLKRLDVRWHASSDLERTHVLETFPWARVLVRGSEGIAPARPVPPVGPRPGPLRLVFIGRLSPMKNLTLALTALRPLRRPVEFDIFGPLEDSRYWADCQRLIAELPSCVRVRYRGELAPELVRPTFNEYDAFLFPTLGENFGHVILESLSASCPVVCSDATPWSALIEAASGVIVRPLTVARLTAELEALSRRSPLDRFRERQQAERAYRAWRQQVPSGNVLEQATTALTEQTPQKGNPEK